MLGGQESLHQILRAYGVHLMEILRMKAFCHAGSMHHIVKGMALKLFAEFWGIVEGEFDEMDAAVGEESP